MKTKSTNLASFDIKTYILIAFIIAIIGFIGGTDVRLSRSITLPIAIIGLTMLFYLSFVKPNLSLLILVAYVPFSQNLIGQFGSTIIGLNLSNILMFIVIIGWIFNAKGKNESIFTRCSLNPLIMLFCLWGLFSVFRTNYLYADYYFSANLFILFKRWLAPILLYFVGLNMVKDKQTFKKVLFVIMLVTFFIGLMATKEYMVFGDRGSIERSRIGGVFGNPNILGAFLVYNMFFFLSFFLFYAQQLKYWFIMVPFLICFRGIMVTFSRGAYLAFAFAALMVVFFKSKLLFVLMIIALAVLITVPGLFPEGIRYRMASTFGGEKTISTNVNDVTDKSAEIRLKVWDGATKMIKDQLLLGVGYGMFPYMIGNYAPGLEGTDAHNLYLIITAEMGIPMLVIFLIIIFMLFKKSLWLLKNSHDKYFKAFALGMIGSLSGLLIANLLGSRLLYSEELSSYFWLLAGFLMRAIIINKNKQLT